jgi:hypothetical protein
MLDNRWASSEERAKDCDRVITIDTLDEHSQLMNEIKSTEQIVNHWGRKYWRLTIEQTKSFRVKRIDKPHDRTGKEDTENG